MMTTDLVPNHRDSPNYLTTHDESVSDGTRGRIQRAVPPNTRAAYVRQGKAFTAWCDEHDRTPLPATAQTLADYLSHLADLGKSPATIEQAMAAIRTGHRQAGYKGQPDNTAAQLVLQTHRHDWAEAGHRKRQSAPITVDILRKLIDATDPTKMAGLRDRVLVVLGFSVVARRSELSALRIEELTFGREGLTVFIRVSKTDHAAAGAEVYVPAGTHPDTDPVRVTRRWLEALAVQGVTDGPVLRRVDRWDRPQPGSMSGHAINLRLQTLAERAGVEVHVTAHGLRAGGATESARAGHPVAFIAEHGRWAKGSPQVLEYIRTVDKWRDNPMRGIGL